MEVKRIRNTKHITKKPITTGFAALTFKMKLQHDHDCGLLKGVSLMTEKRRWIWKALRIGYKEFQN